MKLTSSHYLLMLLPSNPLERKVRGFLKLSEGWCQGEGKAFREDTIKRVLDLSQYTENQILAADAAPGLEGEIQLFVYVNGKEKDSYLEITIESNGALNVTHYDKKDERWQIGWDVDMLSLRAVKERIEKFRSETIPCATTSASSRSVGTLKTLDGSQVRPFGTTEEVYRSFKTDAFQPRVLKCANI